MVVREEWGLIKNQITFVSDKRGVVFVTITIDMHASSSFTSDIRDKHAYFVDTLK